MERINGKLMKQTTFTNRTKENGIEKISKINSMAIQTIKGNRKIRNNIKTTRKKKSTSMVS